MGHFLTQLEVRDVFTRECGHSLLACDSCQLVDRSLYEFLVLSGIAQTLVDNYLLELGHLHHSSIAELFDKSRHNSLLIVFAKCCAHYLISSPDFLE